MFIHKVSLRNIRGFETLDFELARPDGKYAGWTVFTGDNGSGKSTLLKAIAVGLLGKDTSRTSSFSMRMGHLRVWLLARETAIAMELLIPTHPGTG
ncbi:MAG: hypothetical protein FJ404_04195 [Verrucomicrobia bacterium]|nr:hypothetical protein [Verrucomicrobiota bacterium]